MRHTKMKELPHEERPYERCVKSGPEHLSDAQLLAVILRTGSVQESVLELATRIPDPGAWRSRRRNSGTFTFVPAGAYECQRHRTGEGYPASVYRRAFQAYLETEGHKESGAF